MALLEHSYTTTAIPEQFNTTETQENNLKKHFIKMIDIFKKDMYKSPKETEEKMNKNERNQ